MIFAPDNQQDLRHKCHFHGPLLIVKDYLALLTQVDALLKCSDKFNARYIERTIKKYP